MDMSDNSIAYTFCANITLFCHTVLRLHVVESTAQMLHSGLRPLILQNISIRCSFLTVTEDEGQKYFSLSFFIIIFVSQN